MTRTALSKELRPPRSEPETRELTYEGFPLEAVLERVHTVHGTDVTITAADRVRRGGVGGFFAREVFQVTVTAPLPGAEPNFVELGRIGTDDDMMVDLTAPAPESRVDARHIERTQADWDDIDPEDVDGAMMLNTSAPAVDRDDADAEIWALLAAAATATPAATPVARPRPSSSRPPPSCREVVTPILGDAPIASTTLIPPAFIPVIAEAVSPAADRPTVTTDEAVDLADLLAGFDRALPAPPLPAGGIIAVVGNRIDALQVAGRLASSLGIATDDVIVAAPSADIVVPSEADAMRLAATTRYRCNPTAVIAVELVAGRLGFEWARAVLDGLQAEQVHLATDTARLMSQHHLTVAALGGVDVIDLLNTSSSDAPEAALELGTPVATIDGRPATAEMWAATVLAARLRATSTVDRFAMSGR